MNRIAIVTDSNSGIRQSEASALGVHVVPMPFYIDNELFYEDISLTQDEFYRRLREGCDIKTAQPSPEDLTVLWDRLLKDHDAVIHMPMSGGLSGAVQTAKMLAQDYRGRVRVVDNKRISVTLRQSVMDALRLRDKGYTAAQIGDILERDGLNASIYIAVDTLEYLKKGGRVTPTAASLATLLDIKPVLQIQGDKLDAYARVRGAKHARRKMLDAIETDMNTRFKGQDVLIHGAYTCDETMAAQWKAEIEARFPGYQVRLDRLSLSVACHIGEGSTAVVCIGKLREAE